MPQVRAEESPPPRRRPVGPRASPSPRRALAPTRTWCDRGAPLLAGGLLTFPPSFASEDGRYDLIIHLNGNTDLVEESYGYAGVNAVVMILNLGVGSGVYEDRFADPAALQLILDRVQSTLVEQGSRRRSSGASRSRDGPGYGGVIKLLQHEAVFDRIDAVVLFDSIHCGIEPWSGKMKPDQIDPIRRFAKKAVEGRALLSSPTRRSRPTATSTRTRPRTRSSRRWT